MKQYVKKLLLLVFSAILLLGTLSPANAAAEVDYDDLFDRSLHADGAFAEAACAELAQAYQDNAQGLISALALCGTEDLAKHADHLVYGMMYGDLSAFRAGITEMASSSDSSAYTAVLQAILDALDRFDENRAGGDGDAPPPPPDDTPFDAKTILGFIDQNEKSGNVDEKYFHILGEAFRSAPQAFMEMLRGRSDASLEKIAKAVVYDCLNHSSVRRMSDVIRDTALAEKDSRVYNILFSAFRDPANAGLTAFDEKQAQAPASKSTRIPSISTISYTTAPLIVGSSESLSVTFMEVLDTDVTRTYYAEIYCIRNGTAWYKTGKSFWIPAGSTSRQVLFTLDFSTTGDVYTLVKVYSAQGGTLLNSRQAY